MYLYGIVTLKSKNHTCTKFQLNHAKIRTRTENGTIEDLLVTVFEYDVILTSHFKSSSSFYGRFYPFLRLVYMVGGKFAPTGSFFAKVVRHIKSLNHPRLLI